MEQRIASYLAHRMPQAQDIQVDGLAQIYGGSSQETFRLRARWSEAGQAIERKLILRRDSPAGIVMAERDIEYMVYKALEGLGLPIPTAQFLELGSEWLDRPFFIMELCDGKPGNPFVGADPHDGHGAAVERQFWRHMGRLAAIDHRTVGLERLRNGEISDGYWAHELNHWEAQLDAGEGVVEPIVRGAIRWLRANPPPEPAKPAIVHGDYRSGNYLFTADGRISAILDWEMCHIGDPLEDVVWASDRFWAIMREVPLEEGLALWEEASGLRIDREALRWWEIFASVKACALWTAAEASFESGTNRSMILAITGFRGNHFHRKQILVQLRQAGAIA